MAHCLLFGLSGAVGRALLALRNEADPPWLAVTRQRAPTSESGVHWRQGALPAMVSDDLGEIDAIASLGPLDAFAHWFAASAIRPERVIALGSTSVDSKRDSPDPAERDLATRLAEAEARLTRCCRERGSALLILRPTLIYGMGGDRSLSRLVALAQRFRWLPISARATGLRMPVHAADIADVVARGLRTPRPWQGVYALPGGEALPFRAMLERTLVVAVPRARLLSLPHPLFLAGCALSTKLGLLAGATAGMLSRLDQDLLADATAAGSDLGYAPRPFQPTAEMFRDEPLRG